MKLESTVASHREARTDRDRCPLRRRPSLAGFTSTTLGAIAALALLASACGDDRPSALTGVVSRGEFTVTHVEPDGELASLKPMMISPRSHGQIEFLAKDLSRVEEGEVLIRLDETHHKSEVKRLNADLVSAEKRLTEALKNIEVETAQLEVELERRKASLRLAEVKLEELRDGAEPEDISIAEKDLEAAEAALAFANGELQDSRDLLARSFATQAEMDSKTLAREFALARFEKARMQLDLLRRGPTAHDLRPSELAVEGAKIDVEMARERMKTRGFALKQSIAWVEGEAKAVREHRDRHQETLEHGTIRAPRSGLVVRTRIHHRGNRKTDVGDEVWPGRGVLKFPDLTALKAQTRIPEALVRLYKVGDEVTVIVDDIPDERFKGRIVWIDSWARDRNFRLESADRKQEGLSGVRVFRADVELLRVDRRMRLGSKLRVEMKHVIPDTVYVDRRAIVRRGGRAFARVIVKKGTVRLVPVVLGESNATAYVVRSGLKPGTPVAFSDDVFGPPEEIALVKTGSSE